MTDQSARIWDVLDGTALTPPLKHSGAITACEFSPDGLRLATASEDTTARIWELQTGRNPPSPFKHEAKVVSVHFISGGTNLVTVSSEGVVRVFDATGGATVKTIKTGNSHLAWFEDERTVLVMNNGNERSYEGGRVWDLVTGSPLSGGILTPLGSSGYDYDAGISLSGEGRRLAAVFDGHLRVWDLPHLGGAVPDWLPRLAEILAGQRLNEESLFEPVEPGEFLKLRELVLNAQSNDAYQRWGEWFFAGSGSAAISPWSPITRQAHVQACLDANTEASLLEALRLAPGTAKPLDAILRLTSGGLQVYEDDSSRNTESATLRAQRAQAAADELLELEPNNPIGWQVKGLALSRLGRYQEALDALDHANSAAPDPAYWHIKG